MTQTLVSAHHTGPTYPEMLPHAALSPLELSDELNVALPMLQVLKDRRDGQVVEFRAPDDSDLPKEWVTLLPYYPNSHDDPKLGFWKFAQEGHPNVYIYSDVPFGETDPDRKHLARMRISGILDTRRHRPEGELAPERQLEVLRLLQLGAAGFESQRVAAAASPKNEGWRRWLGRKVLRPAASHH